MDADSRSEGECAIFPQHGAEQEMIPTEARCSIRGNTTKKPAKPRDSCCSGKRTPSPAVINLLLGYKWLACSCINLRQGWHCANLFSSLTFTLLLLLNVGRPAWRRAEIEEEVPSSALYPIAPVPLPLYRDRVIERLRLPHLRRGEQVERRC